MSEPFAGRRQINLRVCGAAAAQYGVDLKDKLQEERAALAEALRAARGRARLRQSGVAILLNISPASWNAYEQGRTDIPAPLLIAFARLVQASGSDFGFPLDRSP